MTPWLLCVIVASCWATIAKGQIDLQHCRHSLGMQDKRIPDDNLNASSYHAGETGPRYARLDRQEGGGAWCPKDYSYANDTRHWLEVKLPSLSYISVIGTQGRDHDGKGREFTPRYKLNYSRDGVTWFEWRNFRGDPVLTGNKDTTSVVQQKLNPGIPSASYIRFIPFTLSTTIVCARIELFGCKMKTNIISYDMPTPGGSGLRDNWRFDDEFYDGKREAENYHGGLGQLTDGITGGDDIHKTKSSVASRINGFDYVGWKNNKRGDRFVTMKFAFEDVKNFTAIKVHCLSSQVVGASYFSSVHVSFSLDGVAFTDTPSSPKTEYNSFFPPGKNQAMLIVIPIKHAIGRFVRARFIISGKWMLISEVQFQTARMDVENIPDRMPPEPVTVPALVLTYKTVMGITENGVKHTTVGEVSDEWSEFGKNLYEKRDAPVSATQSSVTPKEMNSVAVIVSALAGVILLLLTVVVLLILRQRRLKKTMTPPRYTYTSQPAGPAPSVTLCLSDQRAAFTAVANNIPEKCADPMFHDLSTRRAISTPYEYSDPKDALTQDRQPAGGVNHQFNPPDVTLCDSSVRDGVVTIPHYAETSITSLPPPYATPPQGLYNSNARSDKWSTSTPTTSRLTKPGLPKYTPPSPSESSTLLAEDSRDDTGFCSALIDHCEEYGIIEFPRRRLQFVDKLGEGQFGEVQLCKADPSLRCYAAQNGLGLSGEDGEPVLVAVKLLRGDASPNTKEDFLKEAKIMARLRDPNVVQLLAVCVEKEPYALITEYMENGDLNEYLKKFNFGDTLSNHDRHESFMGNEKYGTLNQSDNPTISCTVLLSIATQIAAGMRYLASLNFVHRDLATRNCLVGKDLTIRISDFGMSRNMYQNHYYKLEGKAVLPIRWMSWECVLMGKFSTASDVWAFGVTIWEIFTLCKFQPYQNMDDKDVIDNMHHLYDNTGKEVYLSKPEKCPDNIFKVVSRCWRREWEDRPKFEELYLFFKQQV